MYPFCSSAITNGPLPSHAPGWDGDIVVDDGSSTNINMHVIGFYY